MRRATTAVRLAAMTAAAALVLAACGGSDGGDGDGEGGSSEPLKLGYILPETGDLQYLGPPQVQATNYAVSEINKAGGVLGNDIPDVVAGDEANDPAIASQSADRVLGEDVDAIIGAAASGMSLAIIDKITGAGVVQCSGSNTAPTFTDYDDDGFYFRTAPSDAMQGPVLADVVVGDGHSKVAVVARADDYGKGLAKATAESLESVGANVLMNETYDPKATNFDALIQKVSGANPDAVVVIAFEEGKQILSGLLESGMVPPKVGLYGADGLRSTDLANLVSSNNPGALGGMKGTAPASADNKEFTKQLKAFAPKLTELQFAPQVFDCVNVIALAAEKAGSTDPGDFAEEMVNVTKDGEECNSYADCKKLLDDDTDIDYQGASGPLDFTDVGEPGKASIEIYGYDKNGKLMTIDTVESSPADDS